MLKLTIKLPDKESPVNLDVDTWAEAYRALKHFRAPGTDLIFQGLDEEKVWSITVKFGNGWWKAEREQHK